MRLRRISLPFHDGVLFTTCDRPVGEVPVSLGAKFVGCSFMNEHGDFFVLLDEGLHDRLDVGELRPRFVFEVLDREPISGKPCRTRITGLSLDTRTKQDQ